MFKIKFEEGELGTNNIAIMTGGTIEIYYKGLTIVTDELSFILRRNDGIEKTKIDIIKTLEEE